MVFIDTVSIAEVLRVVGMSYSLVPLTVAIAVQFALTGLSDWILNINI